MTLPRRQINVRRYSYRRPTRMARHEASAKLNAWLRAAIDRLRNVSQKQLAAGRQVGGAR